MRVTSASPDGIDQDDLDFDVSDIATPTAGGYKRPIQLPHAPAPLDIALVRRYSFIIFVLRCCQFAFLTGFVLAVHGLFVLTAPLNNQPIASKTSYIFFGIVLMVVSGVLVRGYARRERALSSVRPTLGRQPRVAYIERNFMRLLLVAAGLLLGYLVLTTILIATRRQTGASTFPWRQYAQYGLSFMVFLLTYTYFYLYNSQR